MAKLATKHWAAALAAVCVFTATPARSESVRSAVTYSRDIAPLIQGHCVQCHRPGQVSGISLLSYKEVRPWAQSILKQVSSKSMPPYDAAGPIGRYRNDPRLTDGEIALIADWVNTGAPRGNPEDLPPPPEFDASEWPAGEPDIVIPFPIQTIKGDGKDIYVWRMADVAFPADLWVNAIAWRFSDYKAVHHSLVHLVEPGTEIDAALFTGTDAEPGAQSKEILTNAHFLNMGAFIPGDQTRFYPKGQAVQIKADTRFVGEFHFAPRDTPATVQGFVGFYLVDGPVYQEPNEMVVRVQPDQLLLPAGDPSVIVRHTETFETDADVSHFRLHMHARGKSFRLRFTYPDGRQEVALSVPKYRFDWQRLYYLEQPMTVPCGTIAEFEFEWDNSADNPQNPDPAKVVRWGLRSEDEMGGSIIFYSVPGETIPSPFIANDGVRVGPYVVSRTTFAADAKTRNTESSNKSVTESQ